MIVLRIDESGPRGRFEATFHFLCRHLLGRSDFADL